MRQQSAFVHDGDVIEETEVEAGLAASVAIAEEVTDYLEQRRQWMLAAGISAVVGIIVGVVIIIQIGVTVGAAILGLGVIGGTALYAYSESQSPEVTVTEIEKRYWTGHLVPQNGDVMVIDGTESLPAVNFELEQLEEPEDLVNAVDGFAAEPNMPVVLDPDDNVESRTTENLQRIKTELENTVTVEESVPVIDDESAIIEGIERTADYRTAPTKQTTSVEIDLDAAEAATREIEALESQAFEDDVDETLTEFKSQSANAVDTLTTAQEGAVEVMNSHIERASDILATVSYNFYCPDCLTDDVTAPLELIKSSTELQWQCETCHSKFTREDELMPKHRIKDELVETIWDQLWIEKDDQRREIYQDIEDRKEELSENEFEEKREEIRNTWNRIRDSRSKIRDLRTEARTAEAAVENLSETMYEYNRLREERKSDFKQDVQAAVKRVDSEVEKQIEDTRAFEEEQTKKAREESSKLSEVQHHEENTRHREKMAQQALLNDDEETATAHLREAEKSREKATKRGYDVEMNGLTAAIHKIGTVLNRGPSKEWRQQYDS